MIKFGNGYKISNEDFALHLRRLECEETYVNFVAYSCGVRMSLLNYGVSSRDVESVVTHLLKCSARKIERNWDVEPMCSVRQAFDKGFRVCEETLCKDLWRKEC